MIEAHYEQHYFEWQRKVGVLSAEIILPLFQQHVAEDHRCVDFGCGGGYLLEKIHCTQKIGVEINEVAVRVAEEKGLKVVKDLESIPDQWADVIISNHALEHVLHPADVLATMYRKLKPGGKLVLRVPHEVYAPYNAGDPNKHLYTWSPMNIGNLTTALGFRLLHTREERIVFPPKFQAVYRIFGKTGFNAIAWLYSRLFHRWYARLVWQYPVVAWNVLCVAQKPHEPTTDPRTPA